jgi:hypothetical protein
LCRLSRGNAGGFAVWGAIAKEYDAPMTPRLDWLHHQVGTHQSDGTFHSLCQRSKTTITLRSSQARKIYSVTVIVRYCQNQNVTSSARARAKSAKALGLKMAALSSEVGYDTPQRRHRIAPSCTVAAQCRQVSLTKTIPRLVPKPIRDSHQDQPNQRHHGRFDNGRS